MSTRLFRIALALAAAVPVAAQLPAVGSATAATPAAALSVPAAVPGVAASVPGVASAAPDRPYYSLVSMPDFLNADIADTSNSPYAWDGQPASTNAAMEQAIATVLDEVAAQRGDDVLVAGDQVFGHWYNDRNKVEVFGPVDTEAQKDAAMKVASDIFYTQYLQRFAERGLTVHAAIGDHEVGDNPWRGPENAYKASRLDYFKQLWGAHFTAAGTRYAGQPSVGNYATMLHPKVMLVTVDVFSASATTGVKVSPSAITLDWLDATLREARRDRIPWVIVQAHTPVLRGVVWRNSSHLFVDDGHESRFFRILRRNKVDLYLCGEVHDTSTIVRDGLIQVAHGGLLHTGQASYLTADFDRRGVTLRTAEWVATTDSTRRLWMTDRRSLPAWLAYQRGSHETGFLRLSRTGRLVASDGALAPDNVTGTRPFR